MRSHRKEQIHDERTAECIISDPMRLNDPYPKAIQGQGAKNIVRDGNNDAWLHRWTIILGAIAAILWVAHPFWVDAGMPTNIAELIGT